MPWEMINSTVVVVAKRFNVTAARIFWLEKHGIVAEQDLLEGSLFSDAVVQARTSRFQLLILPDQLQFVPAVAADEEQALILDKLGTIVKTLPHVPYKGMGLNFTWHLVPEDGDTNRATRELFYVPDRPLFRAFSGADARYGGYLSKDFDGFRLKLDVKPMTVRLDAGEEQHRVQFAFNFHRDIAEEGGAEDIAQRLTRWNDLRAEAERITQIVEG